MSPFFYTENGGNRFMEKFWYISTKLHGVSTELDDSDNDLDSYFEGSRLKCLSEHRLSRMRFPCFYPGPSNKFWDSV
jgi:hypothetical protein